MRETCVFCSQCSIITGLLNDLSLILIMVAGIPWRMFMNYLKYIISTRLLNSLPTGFLSILMVLGNSLASCPEEVWFQEKKKERKNLIKACSTYKKGFILVFFSFPVYFNSSPQFFTLVSYRGLTEKEKN